MNDLMLKAGGVRTAQNGIVVYDIATADELIEKLQRERDELKRQLSQWHFVADEAAAAPTRKEACAIVTEAYEKSPTGLLEIQAKAVEDYANHLKEYGDKTLEGDLSPKRWGSLYNCYMDFASKAIDYAASLRNQTGEEVK